MNTSKANAMKKILLTLVIILNFISITDAQITEKNNDSQYHRKQ